MTRLIVFAETYFDKIKSEFYASICNLRDISFKITPRKIKKWQLLLTKLYFFHSNLINLISWPFSYYCNSEENWWTQMSVFLKRIKGYFVTTVLHTDNLLASVISLRKCFLEIRSFMWQSESCITHTISLMHWLFISETVSSWHKETQNGVCKCHDWKLQWNRCHQVSSIYFTCKQ